MSDFTLEALSRLRDRSHFQWYVISLLAFVFYVYIGEIEKRNWNLILAGLAFWGTDWLNEIVNGLVLHGTGYAPIWGEPGPSAYLILVGLNIETMFMFAVAGIAWKKLLHPNIWRLLNFKLQLETPLSSWDFFNVSSRQNLVC